MAEKLERMTVLIPPEVKEALKKLAEEKGLTMSSYVRMVLTENAQKK